jgi:AraC-like DNA-binding protein
VYGVKRRVSTMLTPAERHRVDAAGEGLYQTLHRDSIHDVVRDVRENRAAAILVSVARIDAGVAPHMADIIRQFPGIPALALLTHLERTTPLTVLSLGRSGFQRLIDARSPDGWRSLRDALAPNSYTEFARRALIRLNADVPTATAGYLAFLDRLFNGPSTITNVAALADALHTRPNAFATRFYRARLPSPRRYLNAARLTRVAHLLENPDLTLSEVANALDFSSPQALGRSITLNLTMTPTAFRHTYDGLGMLDRFRTDFLLPYRQTLTTFEPLPP